MDKIENKEIQAEYANENRKKSFNKNRRNFRIEKKCIFINSW